MSKQEFLARLRQGLAGLPQADLEERLSFYREIIDDRMEEGLSEEEAVAAMGPVEETVAQILADTPLVKLVKEKIRPKRALKAWEIVLLSVGSPVWVPLLIAAFAVLVFLYVALWSVVIALWAGAAALVGGVVAGIVAGTGCIGSGYMLAGVALWGGGIVCAGLAIFWVYGCRAATKSTVHLAKTIVMGIKNGFVGKGEAV